MAPLGGFSYSSAQRRPAQTSYTFLVQTSCCWYCLVWFDLVTSCRSSLSHESSPYKNVGIFVIVVTAVFYMSSTDQAVFVYGSNCAVRILQQGVVTTTIMLVASNCIHLTKVLLLIGQKVSCDAVESFATISCQPSCSVRIQ